jgi:hypothetical protein
MALIGFVCYPPPNTATVCQTCDNSSANGPFCGPGTTCLNSSATATVCAHYCCTDADCGSGTCTTMVQGTDGGPTSLFGPIADSLGVCTTM